MGILTVHTGGSRPNPAAISIPPGAFPSKAGFIQGKIGRRLSCRSGPLARISLATVSARIPTGRSFFHSQMQRTNATKSNWYSPVECYHIDGGWKATNAFKFFGHFIRVRGFTVTGDIVETIWKSPAPVAFISSDSIAAGSRTCIGTLDSNRIFDLDRRAGNQFVGSGV
jgi:hypothetical protein